MQLHTFETREEFDRAATDELLYNIEQGGAIMLSGGGTPMPIYQVVAEKLRPGTTKTDATAILYSDERMVSSDFEENNAYNTREFLAALALPEQRVLKVNTSLPHAEAAKDYERQLQQLLDDGPPLTLGLLGVGTDGHTASLFSEQDVHAGENQLAIPVTRPEPPHRVSVTRELLHRFERIIVWATGDSKRPILQQMIDEPETLPAGLALSGHYDVELWWAP